MSDIDDIISFETILSLTSVILHVIPVNYVGENTKIAYVLYKNLQMGRLQYNVMGRAKYRDYVWKHDAILEKH